MLECANHMKPCIIINYFLQMIIRSLLKNSTERDIYVFFDDKVEFEIRQDINISCDKFLTETTDQ